MGVMKTAGKGVVSALNTIEYFKGDDCALQLVGVVEDEETRTQSLELFKDNLESVLRKVKIGMPVRIVSVVGASRSGKSFLLSWFVKTLEALERQECTLFSSGTLPGGNDRKNGFSWRGGHEPHTKGMLVWSRPFFLQNMAVLLVDTQGIFDHDMDPILESCLFGLSTNLSSCQIYNVKNQVQVDTLAYLAVYLDRGTAVSDDTGGGAEHEDEAAPFQRLEVLIRDWQNWDRWNDPIRKPPATLRSQFRKYLGDIMKRETLENTKIKDSFRDGIGCFGLPYPGGAVASRNFDGNIFDIDHGFKKLIKYFIEEIVIAQISTETIIPHTEKGEFVGAVERCVQLFNERDGEMSCSGSWLGTRYFLRNQQEMTQRLAEFKGDVQAQAEAKYLWNSDMIKMLGKHRRDVLRGFRPIGTCQTKKEAVQELEQRLRDEGERCRVRNKQRVSRAWIVTETVLDSFRYLWKRATAPEKISD